MLFDSCTVFLQAQLCNQLRCSPVLLLLLLQLQAGNACYAAVSCVAVSACIMLPLHAAAMTVGTDGVRLCGQHVLRITLAVSLIGRLTRHRAECCLVGGLWCVVPGSVVVVLLSGMYFVQHRRHHAWLAYYHLHGLWSMLLAWGCPSVCGSMEGYRVSNDKT